MRHACTTHRVFAPTYPLDQMSTAELEHAVTSPFRFTAMFKRRATPQLEPRNELIAHTTRVVQHLCPATSLVLENSSIYLIPGGRFLLASSLTGVMSLFDLGHNPHAVAKTIASTIFQHAFSDFDVQASSDNLGIRICIVFPFTDSSTSVKILEIFPQSLSPSFFQVAEFSLPDEIFLYDFNKDLFAYSVRRVVGVRNFISDTAVKWHAYGNDSISDVRSISCFENSILTAAPAFADNCLRR